MSRIPSSRLFVALALSMVLGLLSAAGDADDGKKNKKKNKSKPPATEASAPSEEAGGLSAPPAAVVAANRHLLAYDTEAAREALEGLSSESDAWVGTARGWMLEQASDYEAAATELRRAADYDPKNPAPVLFLGDTLSYAGKRGAADDAFAQAEARARALLASKPDDADALYYLGVSEQRQKRFATAAATLEKARALRPDDAVTLFQLGATRFYEQKWQMAFDSLSAALERNSGMALAYYYRGLAASKLDRKDLLHSDLDRFVKMAPESPEAVNARQILSAFK